MNSRPAHPHSSTAAVTPAHARRTRAKIRVLVISGHDLIRRGVCALIGAERDMEVCGTISGETSSAQAMEFVCPDVVVVEPSRCRRETALIQRIRAATPGVRMIALASQRHVGVGEEVCHARVVAHLCQPDLASRVLAAIRRGPRAAAADDADPPAGDRLSGGQRRDTRGRPQLDPVEHAIMELIGEGVPGRAIAVRLHLSVAAVAEYRRRIRAKLNLSSGAHLIRYCVRWAGGGGAAARRRRPAAGLRLSRTGAPGA
jgi:DNA-binding NarL/FixJ family response regulator